MVDFIGIGGGIKPLSSLSRLVFFIGTTYYLLELESEAGSVLNESRF
jgi:hypothetical protein